MTAPVVMATNGRATEDVMDPFDSLLNLEGHFYDEGYQLGVADGARAGYLEGRAFGIEKGFAKYMDMARMHGKALVWAARMPVKRDRSIGDAPPDSALHCRPLPDNPRLEKHIQSLLALVDPTSLSIENSEDAVSDFDDRLNRAKAKVKLIERIMGEGNWDDSLSRNTDQPSETNDRPRHRQRTEQKKTDDNIEDVNTQHVRI